MNGLILGIAVGLMLAAGIFLFVALVRSIQKERRASNLRKVWSNFSLGIAFAILFVVTWFAHALSQWEVYKQDQMEHGEPIEISGFIADFTQASLENWQSEFLQLFSFVVLSAILMHKGSPESKDSDNKMEAAIARIEKAVGTGTTPQAKSGA